MAVRLDDGRRIAFDLKDYAHIDHGYAATIHKSQGVTVDQAHVLATPGMDRHSAYVALSRYRDGVQLHYRSEEHTSELQSLMRISYAVFCLKQKKYCKEQNKTNITIYKIAHRKTRKTNLNTITAVIII